MALSEDQRALLRLLLAGDTYEHVADVLGSSADEVRGRAHEAAKRPRGRGRRGSARLTPSMRGWRFSRGPQLEASAPAAMAGETGRRRLALWIVAGGAGVVLLVVLLVVAVGRRWGRG